MSEETIQYAVELKLDAERKLGEILRDTPKATGAAGIGKPESAVPDEYRTQAATLADLGITKKTSAQAQKLAALPGETFEAIKAGKKTLTQAVREVKETARHSQGRGPVAAFVRRRSTEADCDSRIFAARVHTAPDCAICIRSSLAYPGTSPAGSAASISRATRRDATMCRQ